MKKGCVIFNPAARGEKSRRFRSLLETKAINFQMIASERAGGARDAAIRAVGQNHRLIVAAGGDGTLNEVVNGVADAGALQKVQIGVLPLGTINVFARELGIPIPLEAAWSVLMRGKSRRIDLGCAEFRREDQTVRQFFVQLAGAGLDAEAVSLVNWSFKKRFGGLAYLAAGLQAWTRSRPMIEVKGPGINSRGEFIAVGNGKLYGGPYRMFRAADLADGILDVRVFPRVDLVAMASFGWSLVAGGGNHYQVSELHLAAKGPVPLQLDGEFAGWLPARLTVRPQALEVIVP